MPPLPKLSNVELTQIEDLIWDEVDFDTLCQRYAEAHSGQEFLRTWVSSILAELVTRGRAACINRNGTLTWVRSSRPRR